jgi:AraC family transcriptional regulator, transcriptional activator of pobA
VVERAGGTNGTHPSLLVASYMPPTIAHRTWTTASTDRQARCHLFLLVGGAAVWTRPDLTTLEIAAPSLLWLPHPAAGSFQVDAGGSLYAVAVLAEFVQRAVSDIGLAAPLRRLLDETVLAGPERVAGRLAELATSFAALVAESRDLQAGATAMMGLHLGVTLLHLWRCADIPATGGLHGTGASTMQRYRQLIDLHYREGWRVGDFARRLGVTRAHLHDACLRATNRTPLALLHERLVQEARSRLLQTDLSAEQIGYSLGFRDAGYFNRFFKRQTGAAPGTFRRETRAPPAVPEPSFAAWP